MIFLRFDINDISNSIQSKLRLFAYDCVLYREVALHQDCLTLQQDLDLLYQWSRTWQLCFNVSKCYHLGITRKKIPVNFTYSMNSKIISQVPSTTYPGVTITDNLSWNQHCDNICNKANSTLGLLKRILSGCSSQVKNTVYCSLVRPKLEYASSAWNRYKQCNVNKIEIVQRRAATFVNNDYSRHSSVSQMIKSLGWDSLERRRLINQTCMFYKIYRGLVGISPPSEIMQNYQTIKVPKLCTIPTALHPE